MFPEVPASTARAELPREAGGFRLLRQLGRGGMGVVYLAEELSSGRQVALKVLLKDLSVSGEAFERFRREARLAAAISDSHCVFVFGAHEVEGAPAIAMELCAGQTLDQRIARGERIPIETAVRWTLEILEGLEAAHATGVIHRDVKPSNCFTTEDGHVKVGDFGLSRTLEPDVQLTQSGAFLGSPLYAAPEQIKGREVDVRSDLYSCGATLYALLTGKPPYSGTNIGEVLARILSEPPTPPREIRADIPIGLEKVVLRAMERDPKKRFQDHASFREALQPFANASVEPARFVRRFLAYALDNSLMSAVTAVVMVALQGSGAEFAAFDAQRPWLMHSWWFMLLLQLVPWLYFTVCEGRFGAGFGKWVLGQRVLGAGSGQPSLARAAIRTALFLAPALLTYWACYILRVDQVPFSLWTTITPVAVHLAFFATARRANGYRAVHDLLTGTRVTQMASPLVRLRRSAPPPSAAPTKRADLQTRVGPYDVEGSLGRTAHGEVLQGRDPELQRTVWIYAASAAPTGVGDQRRTLARPGRLRWLGQSRADEMRYEVFEAPGGTSLHAWASAGGRMSWPMAHRYLSGLAEELAACEAEHGGPQYEMTQVWLDRSWNARLVDVPFGAASTEKLDALGLFVQSARTILSTARGDDAHGLDDLPAHADPVAERLLGRGEPFSSAREAHRALADLAARPAALTTSSRATQILLALAIPSVTAAVILAMSLWIAPAISRFMEGQLAMNVLHPPAAKTADAPAQPIVTEFGKVRIETDAVGTPVRPPEAAPLTQEQTDALETLAVHGLQPPFGNAFLQQMDATMRQRYADVMARRAAPTEAEVARASDIAAPLFTEAKVRDLEKARSWAYVVPAWSIPALVALWGVVATIASFFGSGGLTMRLCGIRVRSRKGPLASRLRCTGRAALAWIPLAAGYFTAAYCTTFGPLGAGIALFAVVALAHAAGIAHALWSPTRSIVDRVAGTTLVPR